MIVAEPVGNGRCHVVMCRAASFRKRSERDLERRFVRLQAMQAMQAMQSGQAMQAGRERCRGVKPWCPVGRITRVTNAGLMTTNERDDTKSLVLARGRCEPSSRWVFVSRPGVRLHGRGGYLS